MKRTLGGGNQPAPVSSSAQPDAPQPAANYAYDRQVPRESWEKQVEATRLEILAQVEKSRAALLASAKPHL
jgi:hypothetical protein